MNIDRAEIVRLNEDYGGQWDVNHPRRLLQLVSIIGSGHPHNADAA